MDDIPLDLKFNQEIFQIYEKKLASELLKYEQISIREQFQKNLDDI